MYVRDSQESCRLEQEDQGSAPKNEPISRDGPTQSWVFIPACGHYAIFSIYKVQSLCIGNTMVTLSYQSPALRELRT